MYTVYSCAVSYWSFFPPQVKNKPHDGIAKCAFILELGWSRTNMASKNVKAVLFQIVCIGAPRPFK
jgi:hypothetical protein